VKKILTLALIAKEEKILLGMKKRGFGMGWWNGFGGKVELDESIGDAAKREVHEEVGLEISAMEEVGLMNFHLQDRPEILEVHLFKVSDFSGVPTESEEMKPRWFSLNELPFDKMWSSDLVWYPYFLSGGRFMAEFWFDKDKKVIKYDIKKVQ
jgi:8-oxo-dGTP pyrophosphatase MutT (NUDIX family)